MNAIDKSALIVDDDKTILRTFTRILQKAGFVTEAAETGKEAADKIKSRNFDVALIDVILGDSNGLDLIPKIAAKSPKTIKIVLTGADSYEKKNEAHRNGADVYLPKPVNPELLLEIIKEKLENKKTAVLIL